MAKDQGKVDEMGALIEMALKSGLSVADTLWGMGYRKDPYPEGKSKDELIAKITSLEGGLARARLLLTEEHSTMIGEVYAVTMKRHRELNLECQVCTFLDETSRVKG